MIRKRKLDVHTKNAVLYMQNAAINRKIASVTLSFFVYSILKSGVAYLERFFSAEEVASAAVSVGEMIPESGDKGSLFSLEDIVYDPAIKSYIESIEDGGSGGLATILLDITSTDDDIGDIFEQCNLTIGVLEKASRFESGTVSERRPRRDTNKGANPKGVNNIQASRIPVRQDSVELASYCRNLTEMAKAGELSDVFCREAEIGKVIISLLRKIKCNPMLIGEPGVGKTAIVEGLATQIVSGNVPDRLKGSTVMSLDVSALVGGTTLRGEFEDRMKKVMLELTARKDVILFIDEVHMIVGAGDHAGTMDASQILKPYLARGEIKCIGATTHGDYNKYLKKDGALVRRFQRVTVGEMDANQTLEILRRSRASFENFHGITVDGEALGRIITLTKRHIADRYFPDKALDCLDESCARAVVLEQSVTASLVEEAVSDLAAVPLSVIRTNDIDKIAGVRDRLLGTVLGNEEAVRNVCEIIMSGSSLVSRVDSPLCSMVLYGPKGVGKKSCIRTFAEMMYGHNSLVEISGTDYTEPHSVSKIIGSPPGYVAYNEEGILFSSVRRRPYSIVMISDYSIMSSSVKEQFIKILKTGFLDDAQGGRVDFRSATIVFVESVITSTSMGFSSSNTKPSLEKATWSSILDRVDADIGFGLVTDEFMREIADLEIEEFERACCNSGTEVEVSHESADILCDTCTSPNPSEFRRKIRRKLEQILSALDVYSGMVIKPEDVVELVSS